MPRQHIFQPCIPTRATKVPTGPDWLHEIKHDGYKTGFIPLGVAVNVSRTL